MALRVVSARLVASTETGLGAGMAPGAWKSTCKLLPGVSGWQGMLATTQIWPTVPLPFVIPLTIQLTALLALPKTWAVSVIR